MNDSKPKLLSTAEIEQQVKSLEGWNHPEGSDQIEKEFSFENFYETMAFVNAVAWIANQMDHHPDMEVSYNSCKLTYTTHSAGGLTENDFEAATRIENL